MNITSVITGDIIKSRSKENPDVWMTVLKKTLSQLDMGTYEIYRGDSFQIEIKDISKSFIATVYIKACIKTIKDLDVRLAIGIGEKNYKGQSISESSGEAFIYSGETIETLKKEKQNLRIKTKDLNLNEELNLYFKLALIAMDNWTTNSAEIVKLSIEQPEALQNELAQLIGTKQDAISKRQKRAHLEHILELNNLYIKKIATLS